MAGDIGTAETANRVVDQALQRFGRIDPLLNNAGIRFAKPYTRGALVHQGPKASAGDHGAKDVYRQRARSLRARLVPGIDATLAALLPPGAMARVDLVPAHRTRRK